MRSRPPTAARSWHWRACPGCQAGCRPRFTIEQVRQRLQTTFPTATAAVKRLEELGLVTELTGQKKNRSFSYGAYVELLTR